MFTLISRHVKIHGRNITAMCVSEAGFLRRIGILAGLMLLFIFMVMLSGVTVKVAGYHVLNLPGLTDDWHYVLSAAPGEIMYVATFDGFHDDWVLFDDGHLSAQMREAALRLSADTAQSVPFSAARQHFGDFDVRVSATAVEGPLDNAFGVMFRMRDADNFYQFFVSSDGFYRVVRRVHGSEKEVSTWIESSHIRQGIDVTNELRVVANGDRFQFFINGVRVQLCIPDNPDGSSTFFAGECREGELRDTLVDDSLSSGRLGMVVQTLTEPGVVVQFDDVIVFGAGEIE